MENYTILDILGICYIIIFASTIISIILKSFCIWRVKKYWGEFPNKKSNMLYTILLHSNPIGVIYWLVLLCSPTIIIFRRLIFDIKKDGYRKFDNKCNFTINNIYVDKGEVVIKFIFQATTIPFAMLNKYNNILLNDRISISSSYTNNYIDITCVYKNDVEFQTANRFDYIDIYDILSKDLKLHLKLKYNSKIKNLLHEFPQCKRYMSKKYKKYEKLFKS